MKCSKKLFKYFRFKYKRGDFLSLHPIFLSFFFSLTLTLILEIPLAILLKIPYQVAFWVNLLTNPLVLLCTFWGDFLGLNSYLLIITLELGAVIAEGYFYKGHHLKPYSISFLLNLFSFTSGSFIISFIT